MPDRPTPQYLEYAFRHFAAMCAESDSPLYAELSARVARDDQVRSLAGHNRVRQPPPNMLFGAVNFLLLRGEEHQLRDFYPSVGGTRPPPDVWPAFKDFCAEHESEIIELVRTRRVQTNEVGRCGTLLPAFALVHGAFDRPLALIEVGASIGLNLLFDRYHYQYSDGRACVPPLPFDKLRKIPFDKLREIAGEGWGEGRNQDDTPTVNINTQLRGDNASAVPISASMPKVTSRVGVDLAPVDVMNESDVRWALSLIWPDQLDRIEMFRRAIAIARGSPPELIEADAVDVIADLIARAPRDSTPCVFHTHATYQMTGQWRERFASEIARAACDLGRDVAHISVEWLNDDPGPQLHLTLHAAAADPQPVHLASCHHHGRWLEWLAE